MLRRSSSRSPVLKSFAALTFLLFAARSASGQLFENLKAFGARLASGDPNTTSSHEEDSTGGPKGIATADLDGDGSADLATSNIDGTVTVYFNLGDGRFADPLHLQTGAV